MCWHREQRLTDVSITLCCSLDTSVDAMDEPRARIYRQEYHHGLNNIVSAEFPTELRFDGAANWCFAAFWFEPRVTSAAFASLLGSI